jgi:predicted helicase
VTEQQRQRLRNIKRFDQLIAFLRDELDWPIDQGHDEDDLTFDWSDDLGLKESERVGIKEIKQLRPLETGQPWGIFFVNFEKKQLPIVILRRILNALVMKKRASANKAEKAAWKQHDLLFISAYGEDSSRQLTFAHFSEPASDLDASKATLRVLGWDDDDTNLKIDYVADKLHEKLKWPQDSADLKAWRAQWAEAFELRHRQVIDTAEELALRLAELAKRIRNRMLLVLPRESENGELRKLLKGFKTALIHDLDEKQFADMYAQTITYGLFSAAVSRTVPGAGTAVVQGNVVDMVPVTNPFLKEMLGSFLKAGGRKNKLDFDELGIQEVVDLLNDPNTRLDAVLRDFGNRTSGEDPVIHFYEEFLAAYDNELRVRRGVFYTPQPVVSYIVRSVHELLQDEFGLEDGLADTTTWGQMLQLRPGLLPPMLQDDVGKDYPLDETEPFVQILDPATGTATFLVEVIDVIHRAMTDKWCKQGLSQARRQEAWNEYVPKHLLPRLHAFELMMAPYAIAHMKIGLKLADTGYRFGAKERARVYLTNALEPWSRNPQFPEFKALAREAAAVNEIKRNKRFTVVIGNPPYSVSSQNSGDWIVGLCRDFKQGLEGERNIQPLSDDYLKFLRLSLHAIQQSGAGIIGMITNREYVQGVVHRAVRRTIDAAICQSAICDLHGQRGELLPGAPHDENVFDIEKGVAIGIYAISLKKGASREQKGLRYVELIGNRAAKYKQLSDSSITSSDSLVCNPSAPNFFFKPWIGTHSNEYKAFLSINELFTRRPVTGFATHRDHFAIDFDRQTLEERLLQFLSSENSDAVIRSSMGLSDTRDWHLSSARRAAGRDRDISQRLAKCLYRPFDHRWVIYSDDILEYSRRDTMQHISHQSLALICSRIVKDEAYAHVFVSEHPVEKIFLSPKSSNNAQVCISHERPGLSGLVAAQSCLKVPAQLSRIGMSDPKDVFAYVYALLHSPGYRRRYTCWVPGDS